MNALRFVGRVFTFDNRLHFVLNVDPDRYLATVSTRQGAQVSTIEMPVSEVALHLSGYESAPYSL